MKIQQTELSSWEERREALENLVAERRVASAEGTHHSDLLVRGQSDAGWPLSTTLERWPNAELEVRKNHLVLTAIKDGIESRTGNKWTVPSYPDFENLLGDDPQYIQLVGEGDLYAYMIYARHHGFPSPLLDWTKSPYIAAYFAFATPCETGRAAIFAYQEYAGYGKGGCAAAPRVVGLGPCVRTHPRHHLKQAQYTVAITGKDWRHDLLRARVPLTRAQARVKIFFGSSRFASPSGKPFWHTFKRTT